MEGLPTKEQNRVSQYVTCNRFHHSIQFPSNFSPVVSDPPPCWSSAQFRLLVGRQLSSSSSLVIGSVPPPHWSSARFLLLVDHRLGSSYSSVVSSAPPPCWLGSSSLSARLPLLAGHPYWWWKQWCNELYTIWMRMTMPNINASMQFKPQNNNVGVSWWQGGKRDTKHPIQTVLTQRHQELALNRHTKHTPTTDLCCCQQQPTMLMIRWYPSECWKNYKHTQKMAANLKERSIANSKKESTAQIFLKRSNREISW